MNLITFQHRIEQHLTQVLPQKGRIADTMRYSTLGGGKRLRAALVYAIACDFDIPLEQVDNAAAALECLHAYSLIHDDLPAMDNDDLRRGKPTHHKAFDEATAILAGDALNTFAFELLSENDQISTDIKIKHIQVLSRAAGWRGMVGGQMLDIFTTGKTITLSELQAIHRGKTGALISAALYLGALPSQKFDRYQSTIAVLGEHLGVAYQITDDILDVSADEKTLGKTSGKDAAQGKNTYVSLLGLEKSQLLAKDRYQKGKALLEVLPNQGGHLAEMVDVLMTRNF